MSDAVRETPDRTYAALKAGGEAGLRGVVPDDIKVHDPAPEGLVPRAGPEGLEAFPGAVGDHQMIDTAEPLAIHAARDTLTRVIEGKRTGRANQRRVRTQTVNTFKLRDTKIARYQVHSGTTAPGTGLVRLAA